jgi:FkbM family methyltransferase
MKNYSDATTVLHGVILKEQDDMVVHAANKHGDFEPETFTMLTKAINFIKEYVDAHPVFADIGAYTGIYSIFAFKHGCDVHAFEPHPNVYERLLDNINANQALDFIKTHNCALSDADGKMYLNVNPAVRLTSGGSLTSSVTRNTKPVPVDVKDYDANFPVPMIVKIDVEGHEIAVLDGIRESLRFGRGLVILEANTEHHKKQIVQWFDENLPFYKLIGEPDGRNLAFSGDFNLNE